MRVSGHTGGRSPTLSHEKSLEATVLETEELNHRDLYVCTADDSIRTKKNGLSAFAGRVLVGGMRGGSLPGQICVIVAVTNMIITGRWEREKKRRVTAGRRKERACVRFAACR